MNMITVALSDLRSLNDSILPETVSGSLKSGAFEPRGKGLEVVSDIGGLRLVG